MLSLTAVVVSYNTCELTLGCLRSLAASTTPPEHIIVVDNASSDGSAAAIAAAFPAVTLVANAANVGFARAVNQAFARCSSDVVLLLNPDAIVAPDALAKLCDALSENPKLGAVGPLVLAADGEPESHCAARELSVGGQLLWRLRIPTFGPRLALAAPCGPHGARLTERLSGAAMAVRREALRQMAGLDERFFMYFEDADLCRRLRQAGWQVACVVNARVTHVGGASSGRQPWIRDERALTSELSYFHKHASAAAALALRTGIAAASGVRALAFTLWWAQGRSSPERVRSELRTLARCLRV